VLPNNPIDEWGGMMRVLDLAEGTKIAKKEKDRMENESITTNDLHSFR
jgi:hypothetical protein